MHLGFATFESGLCQKKNVVNVLFKNVFIISIGVVTYAFFGFNTHYPGDFNGWFSWGGMIGDLNADGGNTWGYGGLVLAMTGFGDFIFQAMFAATGATIVSGAVAERVKLGSLYDICCSFCGCCISSCRFMALGRRSFSLTWDSKILRVPQWFMHLVDFGALACVMVLGTKKRKVYRKRYQTNSCP